MDLAAVRILEQVPLGRKSAFMLSGDAVSRDMFGRFRMPRVEACESHNVSVLFHRPHVCTLRLTDAHWALYCTRVEGQKLCFLINLSENRAYLVEMGFDDDVHLGTVLYGEVHRHTFFLSDLLVYKGDGGITATLALDERLTLLRRVVEREFHGDTLLDCFEIQLKSYHSLASLADLQALNDLVRPFRVAKVRGLLFVPCMFTTQPRVLSYHLQHHELRPNSSKDTLDTTLAHLLRLRPEPDLPDVYAARYEAGDDRRDMGYAHVAGMSESLRLREVFADGRERALPCRFNRAFKKWQPLVPAA